MKEGVKGRGVKGGSELLERVLIGWGEYWLSGDWSARHRLSRASSLMPFAWPLRLRRCAKEAKGTCLFVLEGSKESSFFVLESSDVYSFFVLEGSDVYSFFVFEGSDVCSFFVLEPSEHCSLFVLDVSATF